MTEPLLSTGDLWLLLIVGLFLLLAACAVSWVRELYNAPMVDEHDQVIVHACPPTGSGQMPCCGRTPLEVPRDERITEYGPLVTCDGAR